MVHKAEINKASPERLMMICLGMVPPCNPCALLLAPFCCDEVDDSSAFFIGVCIFWSAVVGFYLMARCSSMG